MATHFGTFWQCIILVLINSFNVNACYKRTFSCCLVSIGRMSIIAFFLSRMKNTNLISERTNTEGRDTNEISRKAFPSQLWQDGRFLWRTSALRHTEDHSGRRRDMILSYGEEIKASSCTNFYRVSQRLRLASNSRPRFGQGFTNVGIVFYISATISNSNPPQQTRIDSTPSPLRLYREPSVI